MGPVLSIDRIPHVSLIARVLSEPEGPIVYDGVRAQLSPSVYRVTFEHPGDTTGKSRRRDLRYRASSRGQGLYGIEPDTNYLHDTDI